MRILRLALTALTIASCAGREPGDGDSNTAPTGALSERLVALGAAPCDDAADFWCLPLTVPLTHAEPNGPTTTVHRCGPSCSTVWST
jgi:hypothetical protein